MRLRCALVIAAVLAVSRLAAADTMIYTDREAWQHAAGLVSDETFADPSCESIVPTNTILRCSYDFMRITWDINYPPPVIGDHLQTYYIGTTLEFTEYTRGIGFDLVNPDPSMPAVLNFLGEGFQQYVDLGQYSFVGVLASQEQDLRSVLFYGWPGDPKDLGAYSFPVLTNVRVATPEPSTLLLFGVAAVGLGLRPRVISRSNRDRAQNLEPRA